MTVTDRAAARKALDGMRTIVKNEMVAPGQYVFSEVVESMKGSLCGGRKYCAIGSLWVGAGIKPVVEYNEWNEVEGVELPNVDQGERYAAFEQTPGLEAAYDALNDAAERYIKRNKIDRDNLDDTYSAPIEALFEGYAPLSREQLMSIISSAKRSLA